MTIEAALRIIDVRQLPDADYCRTILDAFDFLAPGESLVVVRSAEPRELLRRLQADRKGLFEWSPLESGPSGFRTEVTRRAAERGARRDVTEALAWDHDRLDALEQRAFELFAIGDARGAQAAWSEFTVGLRRHIRFEEEILFPTFEGKMGLPASGGPTGVMRVEHREIERLIEAIGRALGGDGAALPLRADLHELLGAHNLKEERVLYPGTDQCLDSEERDALVARIQAS
jgi:uncharacterized protein (DUF2249 family)/hemerythrin-like domain-containing protein